MVPKLLRTCNLLALAGNPKPNRRFLVSNAFSNSEKERIIPSQSSVRNGIPAVDSAVDTASVAKEKKPLRFLTKSVICALAGISAVSGYATYAYTLDDVEEKRKTLEESLNQSPIDDASSINKYESLIYSAATKVRLKVVELYLDIRRPLEEQVRGYTEPTSDKLLPDLHPAEQHVFTLVLDLNDTLLYTDWKRDLGWRTYKRPGVDDFLQHLGKFFEIVVYSDQSSLYVDPTVERLDTHHYIRYRLSRSATRYRSGKHYRDLSKLNRDLRKVLYVSSHAFENCLQPENCIPVKPFKVEEEKLPVDTVLLDLIPFLEYVARASPADIRAVLSSYKRDDLSKEFIERSKDHQRRMQEQRQHGLFWRR